MKIEKLTDDQVKLMEVVKKEWINLLDTCPRPNRDAIHQGIKWLYKFCKMEEPLVIIAQSPLGAQIAANMLSKNSAQVGAQVWAQVGAQVWAQVGAQVWAQVGAQVWDQVRDQVRAQVRDQVGAQVRDQVRAQVWDQVGAQVWAQVGAQVWDQVRAQVRDQVRDQVGAQVWAQVGAQVWDQELEYFYFATSGSISDFGWLSFYDFFERIGVKNTVEGFATFRTLMQSGVYDMVQLKGICIVSEMPTEIHREQQNTRLHCITGPSVKFADGYEYYSLWGVGFDKELYEKVCSRKMSAKEVLKIENMEQRMAALKFLGVEAILTECDSKLLHKEMGYSLYSLKGITDQTEYALKYACPSTDREYVSFVAPEIGKKKDAILAIASKWKMTKEQYLSINQHS